MRAVPGSGASSCTGAPLPDDEPRSLPVRQQAEQGREPSQTERFEDVERLDPPPLRSRHGRASANAATAGLDNVEFRQGLLERLPIETGWADVLITNGVLNLVPDKAAALAESIVFFGQAGACRLPISSSDDPSRRPRSRTSACGRAVSREGSLEDELRKLVSDAGFVDVQVVPGVDAFVGAPQHSNAAAYGTRGSGTGRR
jgi:hypothetical protein